MYHLKGSEMYTVDALSRYPVGTPNPDDMKLAVEAEAACIKISAAIIQSPDVFATTNKKTKQTAASDEQYNLLFETVLSKTFAPSNSMMLCHDTKGISWR